MDSTPAFQDTRVRGPVAFMRVPCLEIIIVIVIVIIIVVVGGGVSS